MPTYNYKCNKCDFEFAVFQSMNDNKITDCADCKAEDSVKRIITGGTGLIFKGDGFYITDYKKNRNTKEENKEEKMPESSKKENKSSKKENKSSKKENKGKENE